MSDILNKIESLLALSGNNPSSQEAAAALTKAKELMAKYNIDEGRIHGIKVSEIVERVSENYICAAWKRSISYLIADHFRCKSYLKCSRGKQRPVFFGYKNDAEIALRLYEYSISYADKCATEYVRKHPWKGAKGDYIFGFVAGLKGALEEQKRAWQENTGTQALAVISEVPQEVKDAYEDESKDFKEAKFKGGFRGSGDQNSIKAGYDEGCSYGKGMGRSLE